MVFHELPVPSLQTPSEPSDQHLPINTSELMLLTAVTSQETTHGGALMGGHTQLAASTFVGSIVGMSAVAEAGDNASAITLDPDASFTGIRSSSSRSRKPIEGSWDMEPTATALSSRSNSISFPRLLQRTSGAVNDYGTAGAFLRLHDSGRASSSIHGGGSSSISRRRSSHSFASGHQGQGRLSGTRSFHGPPSRLHSSAALSPHSLCGLLDEDARATAVEGAEDEVDPLHTLLHVGDDEGVPCPPVTPAASGAVVATETASSAAEKGMSPAAIIPARVKANGGLMVS